MYSGRVRVIVYLGVKRTTEIELEPQWRVLHQGRLILGRVKVFV